MPTLRDTLSSSRKASVFRFRLSVVMAGPRPGRLDPARDAAWQALRREAHAAADDRFDPRQVLGLDELARSAWQARRLAWLAQHFAGDPRVEVGA